MTIDEAISKLLAAGQLTDEQAAAMVADATVPREGEVLMAWLAERNLTPVDRVEPAMTDPSPLSEEPTPLLAVPPGHDDSPFVPDEVIESGPVRRRVADPPMSRETMWKWIGIGGGMWALGLLILGLWIGGCFSEAPKSRIKSKVSDAKSR